MTKTDMITAIVQAMIDKCDTQRLLSASINVFIGFRVIYDNRIRFNYINTKSEEKVCILSLPDILIDHPDALRAAYKGMALCSCYSKCNTCHTTDYLPPCYVIGYNFASQALKLAHEGKDYVEYLYENLPGGE